MCETAVRPPELFCTDLGYDYHHELWRLSQSMARANFSMVSHLVISIPQTFCYLDMTTQRVREDDELLRHSKGDTENHGSLNSLGIF